MSIKQNIKNICYYMLLFSATIIYLELSLRTAMPSGITKSCLYFLGFVPAQSLFLTFFCGYWKGWKNHIIPLVLEFALCFYYISQFIYYKNFGSLYSTTMIGMGAEAITNFGWTIVGLVLSHIPRILVMGIPFFLLLACTLLGLVKERTLSLDFRPLLIALTCFGWFLGVLSLLLDGGGRQSATAVFHNALAGTDTTSAHIGVMTSNILELGELVGISVADPVELTASDSSILDTLYEEEETLHTSTPPAIIPEDPSTMNKGQDTAIDGANTNASTNASTNDGTNTNLSTDAKETPSYTVEPQILEDLNFTFLVDNAPDSDSKELAAYLKSREPSKTNAYTGMFEGYNLIYICAEAFWNYAADPVVTPTLYEMSTHGIVLNNYYNSFKNTTTNGEFAFDTSLWPDFSRHSEGGTDIGSFYQSATCYMPLGLGDFFREIGVESRGYHNYYGEYYRRILSWPNLGYDCKFLAHGLNFSSDWPSSDLELMEQTVDDYIHDKQFHAYYMTFSGHGPYSSANYMYNKNISTVKELMGEGYRDESYGYMCGQYELERAMKYLLERLEEEGQLERTVIVIAGDHYPYNLSDKGRDDLAGYEMTDPFDQYHSTCIIYNAGMKEPIVSDTYCSNVDILPTILNLFGFEYDSRLFMGRDIFSPGIHKAVLYNMSFLTDYVRYNVDSDEAEWTALGETFSASQKEEYLAAMIDLVNSEYAASKKILSTNFYQTAWYLMGWMDDEDLAEEAKRVAHVKSKNSEYNTKEAAQAAQDDAAAEAANNHQEGEE
ncbi:MAG: LTA synthase family protein [Lachnospiraceae bacterium]|nr:LTA synthase family protein [Lachnospiraceae bacterium]